METTKWPLFRGDGKIEWTQKPIPAPGPGELLIRSTANALCGSERGQFRNGSAVTPGHESVGIVEAAGPGTTIRLGTIGAVYLMDYCGECRSCRRGATNQCTAKRADMGFSHDGGYGPFELVHENIFFPIDVDLTPAEGTLLLDIMGTGGHALKRGALVVDDIQCILIAGAGPIGLGCLAMARLFHGPDMPIYITDRIEYRLDLASKLGGRPIMADPELSLQEIFRRDGYANPDIAIDTTGKQVARQEALDVLGKRGALVLAGHGEGLLIDVSRDLIAPERAVLGSEYFRYSEMSENATLLCNNRAYMKQIITHQFGVDDIQHAFELFFAGSTGKVIIEQ
jgi:threonine dehydrogenase-like Zn-dependent dehydrogenase